MDKWYGMVWCRRRTVGDEVEDCCFGAGGGGADWASSASTRRMASREPEKVGSKSDGIAEKMER
jgi:hypothetical protein